MHGEKQHVLDLAQPDEPPADEWASLEVEPGAAFLLAQALQFALRVGVPAQVVVTKLKSDVGPRDVLRGLAVHRIECGAQRFMALDDSVQRALQCRAVQRTHQAQTHGNVIRLAHTFHLGQEPQALLGK